ncbi:hypothetical protein D3C87_847920 [compost metagenome]
MLEPQHVVAGVVLPGQVAADDLPHAQPLRLQLRQLAVGVDEALQGAHVVLALLRAHVHGAAHGLQLRQVLHLALVVADAAVPEHPRQRGLVARGEGVFRRLPLPRLLVEERGAENADVLAERLAAVHQFELPEGHFGVLAEKCARGAVHRTRLFRELAHDAPPQAVAVGKFVDLVNAHEVV